MKKQNSLYRMTTSEMQIMTYLWNSKEPAIASQIVSDLIPTPELHLEAAFGLYHPEKPFRERPDPRCWVCENRQDLLPQVCPQGEPRGVPGHAGHERAAGPGTAGIFGVLSGKGRLSVTGKSNSQVSAVCSAGTFLYR